MIKTEKPESIYSYRNTDITDLWKERCVTDIWKEHIGPENERIVTVTAHLRSRDDDRTRFNLWGISVREVGTDLFYSRGQVRIWLGNTMIWHIENLEFEAWENAKEGTK